MAKSFTDLKDFIGNKVKLSYAGADRTENVFVRGVNDSGIAVERRYSNKSVFKFVAWAEVRAFELTVLDGKDGDAEESADDKPTGKDKAEKKGDKKADKAKSDKKGDKSKGDKKGDKAKSEKAGKTKAGKKDKAEVSDDDADVDAMLEDDDDGSDDDI